MTPLTLVRLVTCGTSFDLIGGSAGARCLDSAGAPLTRTQVKCFRRIHASLFTSDCTAFRSGGSPHQQCLHYHKGWSWTIVRSVKGELVSRFGLQDCDATCVERTLEVVRGHAGFAKICDRHHLVRWEWKGMCIPTCIRAM